MKRSRIFSVFSCIFAAVASAASSQSRADSGESLVELADCIVETDAATIDRKAPSVTHQILASDLGALNLPETAAALNHLPNVFVRQSFVGDKNALVSIRGTSNRQPGRTLVLADGMLLSNFLGTGFGNSPRWFLVAPEEIEKIAVSYGPYSPLYAGNAIGGAVLFTTKMPSRFLATAKTQFMAQTFNEYATGDTFTGHTAYLATGGKIGRYSFFAFVNRVDNDSQPMSFQTAGLSQTSAPGIEEVDTTGAIADLDPAGAPRIVYGSEGPTAATHDLFKLKLGVEIAPELHARYTVAWWINEENRLHPETCLRDAAGAPVDHPARRHVVLRRAERRPRAHARRGAGARVSPPPLRRAWFAECNWRY
ncbi:MAG: TonB-dependent receptor [Opitutaceae bacterium]